MRKEYEFDKWMEYDEEKDELVLREDAPEEIKRAYDEYNKENAERIQNGERILK